MANKLAGEDLARWTAKNLRENEGHVLKPGDYVIDSNRMRGCVTAVDIPERSSADNHGTITVRRNDGEEAHYAGHGWEGRFRIDRT